ncbi:MAG TPA: hypothetical protein VM661_11925 [Candidatus Sulfotelmatobacter sp.]|jgi:hypothetical protein|nr:hypothetical protein [Candidatus Sulfotelmatobacter sp.]
MKRFGPFVILAILVVVLMNLTPSAMAQDAEPKSPDTMAVRHCPDNPAGTFKFFEKPGQTEQDKSRLETLAPIAKQQRQVCLLSLTDPSQLQSRRIAVRRVIWVRDILLKNGVPPNLIAVELRPQAADPDTMRQVQVIFGK